MNPATKLMPGTTAPDLEIDTLEGRKWKLGEQTPQNFTMIVFYRGLHCPLCKSYLMDLEDKLDRFNELGIEAIAVSGDSQERARKSQQEWGLSKMTLGYGQSFESMRRWGLYISKGFQESEPPLFGEPGLFLVRSDRSIYYIALNNTPFARPPLDQLLGGIDYVLNKNYPTRGTE